MYDNLTGSIYFQGRDISDGFAKHVMAINPVYEERMTLKRILKETEKTPHNNKNNTHRTPVNGVIELFVQKLKRGCVVLYNLSSYEACGFILMLARCEQLSS